jgi:hypothetical protein
MISEHINDVGDFHACHSSDSLLFIQYTCVQDNEMLFNKFNDLAIVSIITVSVAFFYMVFVWYWTDTSKLELLKYDISTVTLDDFTVKMDISLDDYEDFLINQFKPKGAKEDFAQAMFLKSYLKTRIEEILSL